jgi:enoyl-CoA hydratase
MLPAAEARDAGLVSRVVPDELCFAEAMDIARCIAERPPHAVRMAKDAIVHALDMPAESGLDYERRLFELLFSSADSREGLSAFRDKRKPQFTGE